MEKIIDFTELIHQTYLVEDEAEGIAPYPIETKVLKCMEELGEIAVDVLKLNGYKHSPDTVETVKANLEEEIVDLFITVLVLAKQVKLSDKRIAEIFREKLAKWQNKHIKRGVEQNP